MAAQTDNPQMLFAKKIVAMALLIVGVILAAAGIYYASTPMTVIGVIAVLAGIVLLVWKINARNNGL
ncbi:hypothetical protein [Pelagibacterium mangrovi]|uniref:hypothetical protein n=1 Tax=Pelagibacterium mangrovi TaxID=3119828 RepID=UPI002FC6DB08